MPYQVLLDAAVGHNHGSQTVDPLKPRPIRAPSIVENPADSAWIPSDVPSDEVLHVKLNTDFDSKRGLPTLFPVRKNLERADKLLRNMSVMAQVQATFAVIRKHKQFSAPAVSAYQQGQADVSVQSPISGRTQNLQQLYAGSIIDASDKTEYEFPSANIDASGLVAVLQAELRAVAARLVMPEFMLTVDASSTNVATAMVAGAPSVENFKRLQAFFARRFGDGQYPRPIEGGGWQLVGAMWRVLQNAVDGGLLPAEALNELEIQAEGPSITVVNKVAETNRAKTLNEAGILSSETWGKWEGVDYQQELSLGAKRLAAAPSNAMGGAAPRPPSPPGTKEAGGVSEEIKMVFGRCVDMDTHKVVPCPQKKHDKKDHKASKSAIIEVATPKEYERAIGLAKEKFANVPKPTKEEIRAAKDGMARLGANKYRKNLVGNSKDRAKRRQALINEFGDGSTCPCIYCGLKITHGTLEQDKILTTAQGGRYRLPNLVPACGECNKQRGDMPFAEAMKKLEDLKNG